MQPLARALMGAVVAGGAGLLMWASVASNVQRSCSVADTPYLPLCPVAPPRGSPAELALLRHRIASNPGDSGAYAGLSAFPGQADRASLLRAASALAPNDPNVLRARAVLALEQERVPDAVPDLVQLAEHYHHLANEPAQTLARLIAMGRGQLLQGHLKEGTRWFPHVLGQMVELKLPMAPAVPLVMRASAKGVLPPARVRSYIRALKAEGNWVDAYGLWLGQQKGRVPILYNPGFDRAFQPDGFDWEVAPGSPGRAGAIADVQPFPGRGQVLGIAFTGRSMGVPVVRQYLFLAGGHYRLAGQYMASKLRTEGGLAWTVKCPGQETPAGRTAALQDTQGTWVVFQFEFTVPDDCGAVASLQLEPFAPYEAGAGIRGQAYFDAFSIEKSRS